MGQSQSNASTVTAASRHDDASTRTLHSSSMTSHRPLSFFRRISNRLHVTHPSRRFGRIRNGSPLHNTNDNNSNSIANLSETIHTDAATASINTNTRIHTSASSTTSSVRRATQEAARAAAAVTGPPSFSFQQLQNNNNSSSRNSITSSSDSTNANAFWNELLSLPAFRDNSTSNNGNSFLRYLQIPLRVQEFESQQQTSGVQSSASSTTSRRMHILVLEYRTTTTNNQQVPSVSSTDNNNSDTSTLTPPPAYRFLGLRRPRSEVSTTSSTDTIQSMPLSMHSTQTNNRNHHSPPLSPPPLPQQQDGQWIVYVLNNNNSNTNPALHALSSSIVLEDNPSYEDLLWLSNILGPVRPNTTTQAAVDEAIPVVDWSDDTKRQLKDEQCLVCLDEFALKQPVRVLKCHHVFHRECVDRWLCEAHNSCPVCRGVPV